MSTNKEEMKIDELSSSPKNVYKLDITESGGVSDKLKNEFVRYMKGQKYHLLVEEGGPGTDKHYHLHCVVGSGYGTTHNYRKKVMKALYKRVDKRMTPVGLKIRNVTEEALGGALSYIYKDARVLTSAGIDLTSIRPWVENQKVNQSKRLKQFTRVTNHNFLDEVVKYIDTKGISHPREYLDVRNIIADMMKEKFLFSFDGRTRSKIGQILQVYDGQRYALSHLDDLCNFHC